MRKAKSSQKGRIADFDGLTASQIQANLSKIKTQNSSLQAMTKFDHIVTPVLAELADAILPGVWITKITYADSFPSQGGETRSLTLEGAIKAGTNNGQDDMTLGNKFKDELIKQPTLQKICGRNPVIRFTNVVGTSGRSGDKETTFTLTCAKGGR